MNADSTDFLKLWQQAQLVAGFAGYGLLAVASLLWCSGCLAGGVSGQALRMVCAAGALVVLAVAVPALPFAGVADLVCGVLGAFALCFWLESLERRLWAERERGAGLQSKLPKIAKRFPPRRGMWRLSRLLFAVSWVRPFRGLQ